jgi:hypothetical protein
MKLDTAIEVFGGPAGFCHALHMTPKAVGRIEVDRYGQILDLTLMDRILATACRQRAAELRRRGELDPVEADLTQI